MGKNKGFHFDVTFSVLYSDDKEIEYRVKGFMSAHVPAVMHLANGDPGYPAEGGEIEDFEVWKIVDGKEIEDDADDDDEDFMEQLESAVSEASEDYGDDRY